MARESREVWEKRVQRWKRSKLGTKAFAAREGVSPSTLNWWRWRLGQARPTRRPARFVQVVPPVELVSALAAPGAAAIEIVLPGGARVLVRSGVVAADLQVVLASLGAR